MICSAVDVLEFKKSMRHSKIIALYLGILILIRVIVGFTLLKHQNIQML